MSSTPTTPRVPRSPGQRILNWIEWAGNKLPDPAVLFVVALLLTWVLSALLAPVAFTETDPRTVVRNDAGEVTAASPISVKSQLSGTALAAFLSKMVKTFTDFPPLGIVLVAMLGLGVAEHTGFIKAGLKGMMSVTPRKLLTPMLLLVAIMSHTAADVGYVLVIPLGGAIFAAAGRHPVAGIAAAFAGVSGGFSANFLPSSLDPLLQGFTQSAAQIIAPGRMVNPLCNWYFTAISTLFIVAVGWYLTDRVIEPRLKAMNHDLSKNDDDADLGSMSAGEKRGLFAGVATFGLGLILLAVAAWPATSPLRSASGELAGHGSPLMESLVPLIFLMFLFPGIVYGCVAGTVKTHRDVIKGMSTAMSSMGYYLVMAFAAAQFTYAFRESNLGALIAIKGAAFLGALALPSQLTIIGVIILTALVNLLVGSASAKWAILAPIFVPILMQLGLSPELTQAAFRIGDSSTNIVTPLLPYFPLIVVYCQRYMKSTGIGTLVSLMAPYSFVFLIGWTLLLLVYWALGLPLGLQASYTYP
jgi:aminobenzoyl-glutamate transport protein